MDSLIKRPVMRKAFSCNNAIMIESICKPMLFPHQGVQELDLTVFGDGGINATGFQLVDFTSRAHRNFFEGWGRLDSEDSEEHISVSGGRLSRKLCLKDYLCCYVWRVMCSIYRKISNIRRTKSPNLIVSRLVLQLSLPNPMNPDVRSRMKM